MIPPDWSIIYEAGVSGLVIRVAIQNGDVGRCQLMLVSIRAVMNNRKKFYLPKGRMARVMFPHGKAS